MGALQHIKQAQDTRTATALERLKESLTRLQREDEGFESLETQIHALFTEAEREVLAAELARFDIDQPSVTLDGQVYVRAVRCEATYLSAVGEVRVERSLYRRGKGATRVPMELRAGVVEGYWTPLAARQASRMVAHLTPHECDEIFQELGNMQPSKSTLDRLPKALSRRWEALREPFETQLRADEKVPEQAVTMAVSLDGVMVPMKGGQRQAKRAQARAKGKHTRGPNGYREVGCGTLSFYDAQGERLETRRLGRMPEAKKATLKTQLTAEIEAALAQNPGLKLVKLADGAKDNWRYLSGKTLPDGVELIDFYHAAEHLKRAFDAAYGENSPKAATQFATYRHRLRDEAEGVEHVIRALAYQCDKRPRNKKLKVELNYFRSGRRRMRYAEHAANHLPIGSGVVEAACKTLATQRMKRSGMRWGLEGGQAILTLRALIQSDRFGRAWTLLSSTYRESVATKGNVVSIAPAFCGSV